MEEEFVRFEQIAIIQDKIEALEQSSDPHEIEELERLKLHLKEVQEQK